MVFVKSPCVLFAGHNLYVRDAVQWVRDYISIITARTPALRRSLFRNSRAGVCATRYVQIINTCITVVSNVTVAKKIHRLSALKPFNQIDGLWTVNWSMSGLSRPFLLFLNANQRTSYMFSIHGFLNFRWRIDKGRPTSRLRDKTRQ